jgi:signal transduction histidine kinase
MSNYDAKIVHMTECASGKTAGTNALTEAESASDLAHDFRTPLNIIIGFSELLLEEIPGKLNKEQRLDLTDILKSGRRLLGLVNTMLERYETAAREPRA